MRLQCGLFLFFLCAHLPTTRATRSNKQATIEHPLKKFDLCFVFVDFKSKKIFGELARGLCELSRNRKFSISFQHTSFINSLDRRFDFINHSRFHIIFMNVANKQPRRQSNEIENPDQLVAAARHVTDCNCEINNHFMNFFPFKLI